MHDLIGVHDVKIAHGRAVNEPIWTLGEERLSWERDGFDPARDVWVAVDGETIVGYGELRPGNNVVAAVLPEHRNGVHEAILATLEEAARAREVSSLHAIAPDSDTAAVDVYVSSGWTRSREVWRMWVEHDAEPSPAVFPAGVSVRTYTDDDAEDVHRLLDEAYLGWDDEYVAVAHDDWLAFMTYGSDYDPACWFLAETERGRLAGVCLNWSTGWIKDVAVRPEWRRRGLGEALLRHSFHELFRRGVRRIGLKVDSNNGTGAPRLYERLGFVTDRRYILFAKEL